MGINFYSNKFTPVIVAKLNDQTFSSTRVANSVVASYKQLASTYAN